MTRRPPSSTLFPYTPLFRSDDRREKGRSLRRQWPEGVDLACAALRLDDPARPHDARRRGRQEVRGHVEDRKSTRLNSSHSQISYAVFCLKKKRTKPQHDATL